MLKKYRAELNTLNWVLLGVFVIVAMYILFGEDTKEARNVLSAFERSALVTIPLTLLISCASLYAEIAAAEARGRHGLSVLGAPALYVLIVALFMIFPLISA